MTNTKKGEWGMLTPLVEVLASTKAKELSGHLAWAQGSAAPANLEPKAGYHFVPDEPFRLLAFMFSKHAWFVFVWFRVGVGR